MLMPGKKYVFEEQGIGKAIDAIGRHTNYLCTSGLKLERDDNEHVNEKKRRRKIRLIEGNAKCRHLKIYPSWDFCGRCYSV
jgi:hypothetical protein